MVLLREIQRTAVFAWSPGSGKLVLVTGTRAGAVDGAFSAESKLELWDLDLDGEKGQELSPVATISTDSRFYAIAWAAADSAHPAGIIAGALENGSLDLWDAEKLMAGASDALMSRTTKHTGPVKALQFNPHKPSIIATAGAKGELFIYDVADPSSAYRLDTAAARPDDLECLAWNGTVSHILATGGAAGFVKVWDIKTHKASWTLNNRKPVSAIAWDPSNSTKLLVATPDDASPAILLWDLRNAAAPERALQGHEQGVLSLSWCRRDADLLLSCGKDNKTMMWSPHTAERYGEFPEMTNWAYLAEFNPHNPNIVATASMDGKIVVQTIQNTNPSAPAAQATTGDTLDGEDFFSSGQSQTQAPSFSLSKAPSWLACPVGASFGFGGKIVLFRPTAAAGQKKASQLVIANFSVDSDIGSATEKFEESLTSGKVSDICRDRIEGAKTDEERADWRVIETLVGENLRKRVIQYLGLEDGATNGVKGGEKNEGKGEGEGGDRKTKKGHEPEGEMGEGEMGEEEMGDGEKKEGEKDGGAVAEKEDKQENAGDDDFFGKSGDSAEEPEPETDFLTKLAASKGARVENPFRLISDTDTTVEKEITQAIILGNFAKATAICLKEGRMADAFLIANSGPPGLVDKVRGAYLAQMEGGASYLRLLGSVMTQNLWDVVHNADKANWKETMAVLCTFSSPAEFPDLCESLGDRLVDECRQDASFCYLVGSKLEKVVAIWIAELEKTEKAGLEQEATGDSTFSVHARALQQFIEKVTVFRHVTKFTDHERALSTGWQLSALYDKYIEYAHILAGHGQLALAQKYLDLLPDEYPAAEVARTRIRLATQHAAPAVAVAAARRRQQQHPQQQLPQQQQQQQHPQYLQHPQHLQQSQHPQHLQQPQQPQRPQQQAAEVAARVSSRAPAVGFQPAQPMQVPGGAIAPPSQPRNTGNWNDTPMVTKPPPSRRSTPGVAPITSPFQNQADMTSPPAQNPYGTTHPPLAPPPWGGLPSRHGSPRVDFPLPPPPPAQPAYALRQPSGSIPASTAANIYAPAAPLAGGVIPPAGHQTQPPTMGRAEGTPYHPPPAVGPPTNSRYTPAPAPAAQTPYGGPTTTQHGGPPPPFPGRNPGQLQHGGPLPRPPPGPVQGRTPPYLAPPPGGATPPPAGATPPPPAGVAAAEELPEPKHPAGDRSHMTEEGWRIYSILDTELKNVKAKAPPGFADHIKDTETRLGSLFDHLNNQELLQPDTVAMLGELAKALAKRDHNEAERLLADLQKYKSGERGSWMAGVKRLIAMSKNID